LRQASRAILKSDELSGVLLQMELAALTGHRGQHRPAGGFEPRVIVGDDELHPLQATGQKIFQKAPPVDLGFGCSQLAV
jgi:hypothetical protein